MEEYVKFGIENKASQIAFSLPVKSGRLINNYDSDWVFSENDVNSIYRKYRELASKYGEKIKIVPWQRIKYSNIYDNKENNGKLKCSAGSLSWWISEELLFRPCALLPLEYLQLTYYQWIEYINGNANIDWISAKNRLVNYAKHHRIKVDEICTSI